MKNEDTQNAPPLDTILSELAACYELLGLDRQRAMDSALADFAEEIDGDAGLSQAA